jgi:hypothetical protein
MARCQTVWDALPHPDDRVFIDGDGGAIDLPLYDPATWRMLGLAPAVGDVAQRLGRARRAHEIGGRAGDVESFVIGARHLPTAVRCLVRGGRASLPACEPQKGDPLARWLYEAGDDTVAASSLGGKEIWTVKVRSHRLLPSEPEVHRLVLEALLATDRAIPRPSLERRRLPVVEAQG